MRLLRSQTEQYNCSEQAKKYGGFYIRIIKYIYLQIPCDVVRIYCYDNDTGANYLIPFQYATGVVNSQMLTNVRMSLSDVEYNCFYFKIECTAGGYWTEVYQRGYSLPMTIEKPGYFICPPNYVQIKSVYPCYDLFGDSDDYGINFDNYYGLIPSATGSNPLLQYSNEMLVEGQYYWVKTRTSKVYEGTQNFHLKTVQIQEWRFRINIPVPNWYARAVSVVFGGNDLIVAGNSAVVQNSEIELDEKICLSTIQIDLEKRQKNVYFACRTNCAL